MATSLQTTIDTHPAWRHAALDISDAFNHVSRAELDEALYAIDPALCKAQAHWVRHPTAVQAPNGAETNQWAELRHGIAQGDPMSSICFSLTLDRAVQHLRSLAAEHEVPPESWTIACYVDDVILSAEGAYHSLLLEMWRQALSSIGLSLNEKKMRSYDAMISPADLAAEYAVDIQQCIERPRRIP